MNQEPESIQSEGGLLPLPSLHIQGFRAFRDVQIPRLGRINLIVGKNNVGKTTLLEAIRLHASGMDAPRVLADILRDRCETQRGSTRHERGEPQRRSFPIDREPAYDFQRIFFSDTSSSDAVTSLSIGPQGPKEDHLEIRIRLARRVRDGNGHRKLRILKRAPSRSKPGAPLIRVVTLQFRGLKENIQEHLLNAGWQHHDEQPGQESTSCQFLHPQGMSSEDLVRLWRNIVLTDRENDILEALHIIAPEIERVSVSITEQEVEFGQEPTVLIRRKGSHYPEPLRSMGDGMHRVFEIALGLVNSQGGIFLIDEFESGVHYSVQEELWRFLFEAASQLGVQVFATTHSWDCIESFQRAASGHKEEGLLINLARRGGDISATVFDERELEIITRESIEVR